jgi:putative sporulation protein YyaC
MRMLAGPAGLLNFFESLRRQGLHPDRIVFVCIGTDRSTGDAFGPLVGTLLEEAGYPHVIGTLERPCDASNLQERAGIIGLELTVVAFDSCLGDSVGLFQIADKPVEPGKSMGRKLPPVGRYSVVGIVNRNHANPYRVLQETSLHRVWEMAKQAAAAVRETFPVRER